MLLSLSAFKSSCEALHERVETCRKNKKYLRTNTLSEGWRAICFAQECPHRSQHLLQSNDSAMAARCIYRPQIKSSIKLSGFR